MEASPNSRNSVDESDVRLVVVQDWIGHYSAGLTLWKSFLLSGFLEEHKVEVYFQPKRAF